MFWGFILPMILIILGKVLTTNNEIVSILWMIVSITPIVNIIAVIILLIIDLIEYIDGKH